MNLFFFILPLLCSATLLDVKNISAVNTTSLISSLADANPDDVIEVRDLVDDLIAAGELDRAAATKARDDAKVVRDNAETTLKQATDSHTEVAGELVAAEQEVTRLTTLEESKRNAKEGSSNAKKDAQAALTASQNHLDTESNRLDEEKLTLERILELLDTLLPEENAGFELWASSHAWRGMDDVEGYDVPGCSTFCKSQGSHFFQYATTVRADNCACLAGSRDPDQDVVANTGWNLYKITGASVGTVHDNKIFLANGHYIKCFGGASLSSTTLRCEYPLFDAEDYSLNKLENKYLGLYHEHNRYRAGHSWVNTYIGSLFFSNSVTTVFQNLKSFDLVWNNAGTDDNELCYVNGELLKWANSETCNPENKANGPNAIAEFIITGDPL